MMIQDVSQSHDRKCLKIRKNISIIIKLSEP